MAKKNYTVNDEEEQITRSRTNQANFKKQNQGTKNKYTNIDPRTRPKDNVKNKEQVQ